MRFLRAAKLGYVRSISISLMAVNIALTHLSLGDYVEQIASRKLTNNVHAIFVVNLFFHNIPLYNAEKTRGWPNFVFFYFSAPENAFFIFRRFIFRPKKTSAFSFLFFFSVLKWPLITKKESQYFGWTLVTCSPLSTSPPAVHEYCEAVRTEQWADSVCCLCCCSRLVSIAPPARKFLSAPPTSAGCCQRTTI